MNEQDQSRPTILRSNPNIAKTVDAGIAYMAMYGHARAAAYLTGCGVDDRVIARVLLEPHRRRGGAANLVGAPVAAGQNGNCSKD